MTHVDVDGVGYTQASALLGDANRWAAVHVSTLSRSLAGTGAMAGDSSFAGEFAAAYDEAAAATVDAFDDVVGSLAALCRITYASYENHARAELSSILSTVVISAEPDPMSHDLQLSLSPAPPPSLGGDASFLPDWANVILDHVEGFVWPDADVDRLRDAGQAWFAAGVALNEVTGVLTRVSFELSHERSPEIPVATEAVDGLGRAMSGVATTCISLSIACHQYADQVEIQRQLILDLVSDMIRDAVLIAAAGFILGLVTGGSANAVAAWINAGKLGAYAPRLKGFVEALRLYAAGAASGLRTTTGSVVQVQVKMRRYLNARIVASGGLERGAVRLVKPKTWLETHEGGAARAHSLKKHVGKSDEFLSRRLAREPGRDMVSTFTDEAVAERTLRGMLATYGPDVAAWLRSNRAKTVLNETMASPVGRVMHRGGLVEPASRVRLVLVKDASMPEGYRILTTMIFP